MHRKPLNGEWVARDTFHISIFLIFGGHFREIRLKIFKLTTFYWLFQFLLKSFLTRKKIISPLQNVDYETNYCKRPLTIFIFHLTIIFPRYYVDVYTLLHQRSTWSRQCSRNTVKYTGNRWRDTASGKVIRLNENKANNRMWGILNNSLYPQAVKTFYNSWSVRLGLHYSHYISKWQNIKVDYGEVVSLSQMSY